MIPLVNALVRPLRNSELELANRWAIDEGWNPGPQDAAVFNAVDPGSLLALEVHGEPVGVISASWLAEEHGFVGFFVMSPGYRRGRYSWTLMHAALERMGDRVIGAEVIPELVRTYARYGLASHYQTFSFHGTAPLHPAPWRKGVERAADFAAIADYDEQSVGVVRRPFLRAWLSLPDSLTLVFRRDGRIRGFGAARRCYSGVRIGPLQADDPEAAEALFDALSSLAPGEDLSIDCPDINPFSAKLSTAKGLVSESVTNRLYRGAAPTGRLDRVYGLMSFAFG